MSERQPRNSGSSSNPISLVTLLLLGFIVLAFVVLLFDASDVIAQGGDPEDPEAAFIIRNPGYEEQTNGNHVKPWGKANSSPGIIYAEQSAPHSGQWNGALEPLGAWLAMRQKVQVNNNRIYRLSAWVSNSRTDFAHPAHLVWNSNVTGDRVCAYSVAAWATYTWVECLFEMPAGTTTFRVKLKSDAPAGQWIVVDDWNLIDEGTPDFDKTVQALGKVQGQVVKGARATMLTGDPQPPLGNSFASGFTGVCNLTPCTLRGGLGYYEVGYAKGLFTFGQLRIFVSSLTAGDLIPSTTVFNNPSISTNTWYSFEVNRNDATNEWEARVGGML